MKRKKWLLIAITALMIAGLSSVSAEPDSIRGIAASYRLIDTEQDTPLNTHLGKPLLLVFWAEWCGPCLSEIPLLNELHKKHQNDDLRIIAVNMDLTTAENVRKIVQRQRIRYPVATPSPELIQHYGVSAIPASYLYDRNGKLLKNWIGPPEHHDLERHIAAALSGEQVAEPVKKF